MVRGFAREVVEPEAAKRDADGAFHDDLIGPLAATGIFGLPFGEDVGGQGGDTVAFVVALEEIARADQSVAATVANQVGLSALPIATFGTEAQRRRWLPELFSGRVLGSFGLTEPGGGSDNKSMTTRAEKVEGGWVLDGAKMFITNAGTDRTGFVIIAARTGTSASGKASFGAFIVETTRNGFSVGPPLRKLGWRSSDTRPVYLERCLVPDDAVLGDSAGGLPAMLRTLAFGRIQIATLAVGLAQRALDEASAYAEERVAFGRPIAEYQGTSFKLADMAVGVCAARLLTMEAAWRRDRGLEFADHATRAKLFASEVAVRASHDCLQVHGGLGFMDDTVPARLYRDARLLEIGEGTSEILRMVIARGLRATAGAGAAT